MKKISTQIGFYFLMLFTTLLIGSFSVYAQTSTPTVSTDKLDYPPGANAIITGKGFQPNEAVTLQVIHVGEDSMGTDGQHHQPWTISADAYGNISSQWTVPSDGDALGATFKLTADGQISLLHAEWIFTDAGVTKLIVTLAPSSQTARFGTAANITYDIAVTGSGGNNTPKTDVTTNLSITPAVLPQGITASFSPSTLKFTNNGGGTVLHSTLTFSMSNAASPASINFTVQESNDNKSDQETLIIAQATPNFSNLTQSQSITSGTSSVTLTGKVVSTVGNPTGTVTATINGVTSTAANVSSNNGNFNITFNTATLNASSAPYTITYNYSGDNNFESKSDASTTLTVTPAQATTSISNLSAPSIVYGTATTTLSGVISSTNGVPSGNVSITLNGISQSAAINATTGAFSSSFTVGSLGVGSSPYTITYAYAGTSSFSAKSDATKTLTVTAATPTITPTVGAYTYSGSAQGPNTATNTGTGTSYTFTYAGATGTTYGPSATQPTNAGNYTVTVTVGADGNYSSASSNAVSFTISKADATITVTGYTGIYDGNAHGATGTATGVKSEGLTGLDLGALYTNVPGGTATWNYTDATGNYNNAKGSAVDIAISKAPVKLTFGTLTFSYDGSEKSATATASPDVTGVSVNGAGTDAGDYAATASLANANYEAKAIDGTLKINKADAKVVITDYNEVYDGKAHGVSGTATGVGGTDLSTSLNLGDTYTNVPGGTPTWKFTGGTNYNDQTSTAKVTITARPITITADAKAKYCGQVDPLLTYAVTSDTLVGADALKGELSRAPGEAAASYAISSTLANSNYAITFKPANLTITSVAIDASASSVPVALGSTATLSATISPAVAGVTVTFKVDGVVKGSAITNTSGIATLLVTGLTTKVYQIEAVAGICTTSNPAYLPVYDANAGYVTGGGWINSPAGALVANPTATGKANFGFVAKYKKGLTALDGETEFQFQAGNMKFNSTSYENATLVISGSKASYRGVGTINGTGSYKFVLTAVDGSINGSGGINRIRMKITNANGTTVYDNQVASADNADLTSSGTSLGGGSVIIHDNAKGNSAASTSSRTLDVARPTTPMVREDKLTVSAFPNPSFSQFNLKLTSSNSTDAITVRVVDLMGRLIEVRQNLFAGETVQLGQAYSSGTYFVDVIQGNNRKQLKLIKTK